MLMLRRQLELILRLQQQEDNRNTVERPTKTKIMMKPIPFMPAISQSATEEVFLNTGGSILQESGQLAQLQPAQQPCRATFPSAAPMATRPQSAHFLGAKKLGMMPMGWQQWSAAHKIQPNLDVGEKMFWPKLTARQMALEAHRLAEEKIIQAQQKIKNKLKVVKDYFESI